MSFVVGICGPIGAGKSTLVAMLAREFRNATPLDIDDYQTVTQRSLAFIRNWMVQGADPNEFPLPQLANDLQQLCNGYPVLNPVTGATLSPAEIVLLETPFGRLHSETAAYVDMFLWLDTPLDVALARKLMQFNSHSLRQNDAEQRRQFQEWLTVYLENYLETIRKLMLLQRERVATTCDAKVDGSLDFSELVSVSISVVEACRRQRMGFE